MNQPIHELARILALRVKRKILSGNGGNLSSVTAGDGLEFHELRDYQPEDDAKYLHWPSLLAPTGPQLKVYREEQDCSDCIALDVSTSLTFHEPTWNLAAETAALLAAVSTLCGNGGNLLFFAQKLLKSCTLSTGNRELRRATESIARARLMKAMPTNLKQAFLELNHAIPKPHRLFIISDFIGMDYEPELRRLARRHDTTLCQILPPERQELKPGKQREIQDAETGEKFLADTTMPPEKRDGFIRQTETMARKTGANYLLFTFGQTPYQTLRKLGYQKDDPLL